MIKRQPNESRCDHTESAHEFDIDGLCPVSGNPLPGSMIRIQYIPERWYLEVYSLKHYIESFRGGKDDIRSMEGMLQAVAKDCSESVEVPVTVIARLVIHPGQRMIITTKHNPS